MIPKKPSIWKAIIIAVLVMVGTLSMIVGILVGLNFFYHYHQNSVMHSSQVLLKSLDAATDCKKPEHLKLTLVNVWATWCAPCVVEMPDLIALQQKFPENLWVVAVSQDSNKEDVERFLTRWPNVKNLCVVFDLEKRASAFFSVEKLPETFALDNMGVVQRHWVGAVEWTRPILIEWFQNRISSLEE